MQKSIIQEATQHLPLVTISPEPEEWILTKEEETEALAYAVMLYAKKLKHPALNDRVTKAYEHYSIQSVREKLLSEANSNKHNQIWHEQQRQKRKQEEENKRMELIKKCDANYFYKLLKKTSLSYGKELLTSLDTFSYIKTLCFFFSNDTRFETELKFDLNKGLWIRGETGRGKTFPLICLKDNELSSFVIHSMLYVASEIAEKGEYFITNYYNVIDDVGTEQSVINHYGTKINWFKDFIELWYAEQKPFNRLIITTNFDFKQVEQNYGGRLRSRIKDMFNIIDVKGEDLRGKL